MTITNAISRGIIEKQESCLKCRWYKDKKCTWKGEDECVQITEMRQAMGR